MGSVIAPVREHLIEGSKTYHDITEDICRPTETMPKTMWLVALLLSVTVLTVGIISIRYTIWFGIGTWKLNRTIGILPTSFGGLVSVTLVH
jgi:molybdopterin-containing oxidoreductase family membrane subunit